MVVNFSHQTTVQVSLWALFPIICFRVKNPDYKKYVTAGIRTRFVGLGGRCSTHSAMMTLHIEVEELSYVMDLEQNGWLFFTSNHGSSLSVAIVSNYMFVSE